MQIELSTVLGIFGTFLSMVSLIVVGLAKITITNREKEIDRRLDKIDGIDTRLHTEEKATIRQDGEIKLVQNNHNGLSSDIDEIKLLMATKKEMESIEKAVENLGRALERRPGGFSSASSQYRQVVSPTSDPPKKGQ